jgi:hypothetical protein
MKNRRAMAVAARPAAKRQSSGIVAFSDPR